MGKILFCLTYTAHGRHTISVTGFKTMTKLQ